MKIYQKHEVTVKGSAIAVTAEFVLDTFKAFQKCDIALDTMLCQGVAYVVFTDDKKVEKVVLKGGCYGHEEAVIASWMYLYNVLKTTDKDFESDTIAAYIERINEECMPQAQECE